MLARLQAFIAIALLLGMVCCSLLLAWGRPGLALGGVAIVAGGYALVLAGEFWLLWRSDSLGGRSRPSIAELVKAWGLECVTAPRVFLWSQPFRSRAIADSLAPAKPQGRGVLFVHGFFCNRGIWNPWMSALRSRGIPFAAVTLEPLFGSIDAYAATIDAAVSSLERATGRPPVLVGHSMGGLAIRSWLGRMGSPERCHHVVTIGSPHRGTAMAARSFATNVRQMQIGSAWLADLARREPPSSARRFTCFWSRCDNIVFPTRNATLEGADNRQLHAMPHVAMARHPEILAEIVRLATAT